MLYSRCNVHRGTFLSQSSQQPTSNDQLTRGQLVWGVTVDPDSCHVKRFRLERTSGTLEQA